MSIHTTGISAGTAEVLGVLLMPVLGLSVVVMSVAGTAEVLDAGAGAGAGAVSLSLSLLSLLALLDLLSLLALVSSSSSSSSSSSVSSSSFFPFITFFVLCFILFDGIQLALMKPGDVGLRWQDGGDG